VGLCIGTSKFVVSIVALLLSAPALIAVADAATTATSSATAKDALSTEDAINEALLTSNAGALEALLADDWIVVSGFGGIAERKPFIAYVRAGDFTRKKMVLSEARVRVYGNTALVTTHLSATGRSIDEVKGKIVSHCFDVKERQTDVLVWKSGSWKSVLLHETVIPGTLHVTVIPGRTSACT
jgi:ketosteroid isomerase-like protein